MTPIQALNARKSTAHRPFRVSIWAGNESNPGSRADWVIYSRSVFMAVRLGMKAFRLGVGKGRRYSDYTINIEPIRDGEKIITAAESVT